MNEKVPNITPEKSDTHVVLRVSKKKRPNTPHIIRAVVIGHEYTWWCSYGGYAVGGHSPIDSYRNLMRALK